jgi:hypothetical protein
VISKSFAVWKVLAATRAEAHIGDQVGYPVLDRVDVDWIEIIVIVTGVPTETSKESVLAKLFNTGLCTHFDQDRSPVISGPFAEFDEKWPPELSDEIEPFRRKNQGMIITWDSLG